MSETSGVYIMPCRVAIRIGRAQYTSDPDVPQETEHLYQSYFTEHPEMVLGVATSENTQYSNKEYTAVPTLGADLTQQLQEEIYV